MLRRALLVGLLAAIAFGAGLWIAGGRAPGGGPPPSAADPVVALDPSAVSLGLDAGLAVDWGALGPPDAPLPVPGPSSSVSPPGPTTAAPPPPPGSSR